MTERILVNIPDQSIFTDILDILGEAIISVDEDYRIILFNKEAEQVFGYAADEIVGQPLNLLFPQRFRVMHQVHIDGLSQSDISTSLIGERQEVFGLRKNGQEFPATASISKVGINNQQTFTVIVRDITQQKQLESLVEDRTKELNNALAETKKLNEKLKLEITKRKDAQQELQTQISSLDGLLNAAQ